MVEVLFDLKPMDFVYIGLNTLLKVVRKKKIRLKKKKKQKINK